MAVGLKYRELSNIRPVGMETIVEDFITIPGVPGAGSYLYRLSELPLNIPLPAPYDTYLSSIECREVDVFNNELAGPILLEPIDQNGTLTTGKFVIKSGTPDADDTFKFGQIRFSQFDAGRRFKVIYTGRGSLVYAEDILNLNTAESLLPGTIKPDHISADPADVFTFPGDVNIQGDINFQGVVNKSISEIATISDDYIRLNDGQGSPTGPNMGIEFDRGGLNPKFRWNETDDSFDFVSTTGVELLKIYDTGTIATPGGVFKLPSYTTAQEGALVTLANIPGLFYNSDERQVKAVVDDGVGGADLIVLG